MSVAPLIAGNTVILKPAEQTPLIAKEFLSLMRKSGFDEKCFDIVIAISKNFGIGKNCIFCKNYTYMYCIDIF